MPVCLECGHQVAFIHHIHGSEIRLYDANGNVDSVESQQFETDTIQCAECKSQNVEIY
jgi:DNA-directed RNA polymerase subunit RPC12/RpoP